MTCAGKVLESSEAFKTLENDQGNILIEVAVNGMFYNFLCLSGIYDIYNFVSVCVLEAWTLPV